MEHPPARRYAGCATRARRNPLTDTPAEFIPPFPPRHPEKLPAWKLFMRARRNMLTLFSERSFAARHIRARMLRREFHLFNTPAAIHSVMVAQNDAFERKTPQMRHALEPLVGDGLIISDGLVWKERRRVVQAVTRPARMPALTPVMTGVAEETLAAWRTLPEGHRLDVMEEMGRFAAQTVTRAAFGLALGRDSAARVVAAFAAYQARIGNLDFASLLGLPDVLPRLNALLRWREVREIHGVVEGLIADVLDHGRGEDSLIAAMAEAPGMTREGFRNEALTLFLAGHETTANVMSWCWYLLSQAPWAEARLREEASAVLGGRAAGFDDLARLPYTRAVVEETLRLYPPIPILAREAQQDTEVEGIAVRRGSMVMVSPWVMHRHRAHWEAPDAFRPERFLPGAPPPVRHSYLPFSLGPRVCTGVQFGLYEAMICLASLAQHIRLRAEPGHVVMPVSRLTLRPGTSLPMRIAHLR